MYLSDFYRPFSIICEMENSDDNSLAYSQEDAVSRLCTTITFPVLGKNGKHQVVIYTYYGVEDQRNKVRHIFQVQGQLIHSLTQVKTKYLVASLDKELRIYDIVASTTIRSI